MVIYDRLEDIPYEVIKGGGEFQVREAPPEMNEVGQGMYATSNPVFFPWLLLFKFIVLIIGIVGTVVVIQSIESLFFVIKAIPEGKVIDILEDGTRVFQAADGSTWLLHEDGTITPIAGPPPAILPDIAEILTVVAVIVVVGLIAYLVFTFTPKLKAKKEEKKAAPEPG